MEVTHSGKHHKGAARRYWCSEFLDEKGRLCAKNEGRGCDTIVLKDGMPIPNCPNHGKPMLKTRFKRVEEKHWEVAEKRQFTIGGGRGQITGWTDVARRTAKCHICMAQIDKGETRIAFDTAPFYGAQTSANGGTITRTRYYVHRACFIDVISDGQPGEGCPGCSAKMLNDEFRAIRKILEKHHASGT